MSKRCKICERLFKDETSIVPTVLATEIGTGDDWLRLAFTVDMCSDCRRSIYADMGLMPAALVRGLHESTPFFWEEKENNEKD